MSWLHVSVFECIHVGGNGIDDRRGYVRAKQPVCWRSSCADWSPFVLGSVVFAVEL